MDLTIDADLVDAVDSALAHVKSELDSANGDNMTDDIREFDVSLLAPQVPEHYVNAARLNAHVDVEAGVRTHDVDDRHTAGREASVDVRVSEADASQHVFRVFTNTADGQMLSAISHLLDQKIGLLQKSHDALNTKTSQFDNLVFKQFAEQDKRMSEIESSVSQVQTIDKEARDSVSRVEQQLK